MLKTSNLLAVAGILIAGFATLPATAEIFTEETNFGKGVYGYGDYRSWDLNSDGQIEEEEFSINSYSVMDSDRDNRVSKDEWDDYTANWYDPYEVNYGEFEEYDTDRSGYLDEREYSYVLEDTDLYAYWDYDSDGYVGDTEYNDAINVYADYDSGIY